MKRYSEMSRSAFHCDSSNVEHQQNSVSKHRFSGLTILYSNGQNKICWADLFLVKYWILTFYWFSIRFALLSEEGQSGLNLRNVLIIKCLSKTNPLNEFMWVVIVLWKNQYLAKNVEEWNWGQWQYNLLTRTTKIYSFQKALTKRGRPRPRERLPKERSSEGWMERSGTLAEPSGNYWPPYWMQRRISINQ